MVWIRFCVKAAGVPIGSSYADLYEAMKFNRDMKYTLLYYGKNHLHRIKAQSMQDQLEQEIYTQPIIADMIQQEKEPDDEKQLDIFEKMSRSMESAQFNRLLEGLHSLFVSIVSTCLIRTRSR